MVHVCILFLGDFRYDGRIQNIFHTLQKAGYRVSLFCTIEGDEAPLQEGITVISLHRWFWSKLRFFEFYYKGFCKLLSTRAEIYHADDLYSLPIVWLAAKRYRGKIIYDVRDLYFALAPLRQRRYTQAFWSFVERLLITSVNRFFTASNTYADSFASRYGINRPLTVGNYPRFVKYDGRSDLLRKRFHIRDGNKILVYQGILLHGRGLFTALEAVRRIANIAIVYLGYGPLRESIERQIIDFRLEDRAFVFGPVAYSELLGYTNSADIGLALIEPWSTSYELSQPNKLFEYLMAGIPVIASNISGIEEIIEKHGVGLIADVSNIDHVCFQIKRLISDRALYGSLKRNCRKASTQFCWEKEEEKLLEMYSRISRPVNGAS